MHRYHAAILLVASMLTVGTEARADDWRQFGGPSGDFQLDPADASSKRPITPKLIWRQTVGPGLAGIATSDELLFACHLDADRHDREAVTALEKDTGNVVWSFDYAVEKLESQEAFGGRKRSPQATPLVIGDTIITLGFTGWLHAFDKQTGDVRWKVNLVQKFQSVPVQFGFSASPIEVDGQVVVLAGGQKGGLIALDRNTGQPVWRRGFDEASYATPVVMTNDGSKQIVYVTRQAIVGVDASNGNELWNYPLPKPGLTNVPTPLAGSDGSLIVSGQGIGGTARLQIQRSQTGWEVAETWFSSIQFFYCNWVECDDRVIGCNGDLLIAFDSSTGQRLGRWRGYADANLCRIGDRLIALHGKGRFSSMRIGRESLAVESQHQWSDERSWTPPTIVDDRLIGRSGDSICMIDLYGKDRGETLTSISVTRKNLAMSKASEAVPADPIEQIITAFERDGASKAFQLYGRFRAEKSLTAEDHRDLVEMAIDQGLNREARQLAADARQDHATQTDVLGHIQSMILALDRKPDATVQRGRNGLDYVEFAVRNDSGQTLQTYVKGPQTHPFSYGIPFPPGKVRIEKWPVGTKLYLDPDKPRGEVLLEVAKTYAGTTVAVKPKP